MEQRHDSALIVFFHQGKRYEACRKDVSKGLGMTVTLLQYPSTLEDPN
jgi:hypothetical protein